MIDLAVPLDPLRTGGLEPRRYLQRIAALGATAVELQLRPLEHQALQALLRPIAELGLRVHLHLADLLLNEQGRRLPSRLEPALQLAAEAAALQSKPVHLVVHPAGGRADRSEDYQRWTAEIVGDLLAADSAIHPMLELLTAADNRPLHRRLLSRLARRRERSGVIDPPAGTVRAGLDGPRLAPRRPLPGEEDRLQACPAPLFSAGSSREALLAALRRIGDSRAGLCWDLGHDWKNGLAQRGTQWRSIPEPAFLAAVRHVHLHDALPRGHMHLPLQTGNVPFTTQLRALLRAGFSGVVTLEVFFGRAALSLGERFDSLARSLAVARSALRLDNSARSSEWTREDSEAAEAAPS